MNPQRRRLTGGRLLLGVSAISTLIAVLGGASWYVLRGPPTGPAPVPETFVEIPIPEAHWGESAQEARDHVRQVRQRLGQVKAASTTSSQRLAQAYGELGEAYLAYAIPASAIPSFQNAARLDPSDFRWPYLLAVSQLALMETQQAVISMRDAVNKLRRDSVHEREHLLAAYCFLGDGCIRLNQFDEAGSYFDQAIELAPNCVFALFKRGQLASQAGDSQNAIKDYQRALSLYQHAKPAPISRALALEYQKLGQHAEADRYRSTAESELREITISNPNPLAAQVQSLSQRPSDVIARVRAELAKGNHRQAISQVNQCLTISPQSFKVRLVRAELLLQLGRLEDAIGDLETVRRQAPSDEQGRILLIEACVRRPETRQKAWEVAAEWREEQPMALQPQLIVGDLEFQQERFEESRESFSAASRLFPQEVKPRLGNILALCALGRYVAARESFEEALKLFPDNADLKLYFARFLVTCPDETIREPQVGLSVVQELISEESSVSTRETLAYALVAAEQLEEARRELSQLGSSDSAADQPLQQSRLRKLQESIERRRPLTERWPFAVHSSHHSPGP